jgi:hypothetical protein
LSSDTRLSQSPSSSRILPLPSSSELESLSLLSSLLLSSLLLLLLPLRLRLRLSLLRAGTVLLVFTGGPRGVVRAAELLGAVAGVEVEAWRGGDARGADDDDDEDEDEDEDDEDEEDEDDGAVVAGSLSSSPPGCPCTGGGCTAL